VAWELLCVAFGIKDIVLPRPSQIVVTLAQRMPAIWPHALQTLYTTLVGFALGILAGVFLGALVGSSKLAYDVAYPLLVGFSSIPKVAVVPIFVLWFGAGTIPAVLTAMILCVFPIKRRHRARHHRARARRRDARAQGEPARDRELELRRAAGLCWTADPRGARRRALRHLFLHRGPRHRLGPS